MKRANYGSLGEVVFSYYRGQYREALGFLETIKQVHELDLDGVDFELDYKNIVDDMNKQKLNFS